MGIARLQKRTGIQQRSASRISQLPGVVACLAHRAHHGPLPTLRTIVAHLKTLCTDTPSDEIDPLVKIQSGNPRKHGVLHDNASGSSADITSTLCSTPAELPPAPVTIIVVVVVVVSVVTMVIRHDWWLQ